jgi:hypothetical protein
MLMFDLVTPSSDSMARGSSGLTALKTPADQLLQHDKLTLLLSRELVSLLRGWWRWWNSGRG